MLVSSRLLLVRGDLLTVNHSDQIVRTDLKELVDIDLEGAPYGYAPMGDDREEVEGFRFWKTGSFGLDLSKAMRGSLMQSSTTQAIGETR